jgi:hypothetical protein
MSPKRNSIAQVMMVVALAAVNLAVIRAAPRGIVTFPTLWIFLGSIDFVIFWKLIVRRSLRAFHYTFLIVFLVAFVGMANFVAMERLQPLGLLVRWYQQVTGANTISISRASLRDWEFWMVSFLSFALAYATGLGAAWLESSRDWDIAAFFRGVLVGLGIFGLLATLMALTAEAAWGGAQPSSVQWIGRLALLGVCLVLGGTMGLSRLKSRTPSEKGQSDAV